MCYAAAIATVTLRAFSPFVRRPSPAECIALVRLYPEVIAHEILVPNLLPFPPFTSIFSSYFSMHPSPGITSTSNHHYSHRSSGSDGIRAVLRFYNQFAEYQRKWSNVVSSDMRYLFRRRIVELLLSFVQSVIRKRGRNRYSATRVHAWVRHVTKKVRDGRKDAEVVGPADFAAASRFVIKLSTLAVNPCR